MLIYGALFKCLDPCLTIAATLSNRSPFLSPFDKRDEADEARKGFAFQSSDHLTILNAYDEWQKMKSAGADTRNFLRESFLSYTTLNNLVKMKAQFSDLLREIGFLARRQRGRGRRESNEGGGDENSNSNNKALVKAVLCAGLYPNVVISPRDIGQKSVGEVSFKSLKGDVNLHPCSVLFKDSSLHSRFLVYHEIVKTSKIYIRDATAISPLALLLFGGNFNAYQQKGFVTVDDWIKFKCNAKTSTLIKHLRSQMEDMLLNKIVKPEDDILNTKQGRTLVESVAILLDEGEKNCFRVSGGGGEGGQASRSGQQQAKPGDWTCSACNCNNFASRNKCFKCGQSGGSGTTAQGRGGGRGRGRGGGRGGRY